LYPACIGPEGNQGKIRSCCGGHDDDDDAALKGGTSDLADGKSMPNTVEVQSMDPVVEIQ
jgi:hypothetical protein